MIKLGSYNAVQVAPRTAALRAYIEDGVRHAGFKGYIKITDGVVGHGPWLYNTYFYSTNPKSGTFFSTTKLEEMYNELPV